MPNKNYFAQLSPKQKAELFLIYTGNGMYNLNEIMNHYNSEMDRAYSSTEKDMVARMHDTNAPYLTDEEGNKMTHMMASGDGYVFPTIQRNDNGDLENYGDTEDWGAQRAIDRNDTLQFRLPTLAEYFSENYKTHLDNPNMQAYGGGLQSPFKKPLSEVRYENGGDKKYNIFEDKNSYEARDKHRESLDKFIKDNPELYGLKTADFADFLSQIAGLESSYKSDAGKGMTYSGYYGLKGGRDLDSNAQHNAAFKHLKSLFNESIVKEDVDKGAQLGYTAAQVLAKYWNQGNRVTNYLWNDIDNSDGLGTLISEYGNNITADVNYDDYLSSGITDDYVIVKDWRTLPNTVKKARVDDMNYSDRQNYILKLNGTKDKNGNVVPLDAGKLHVGDTLWLKKPVK